MLEKVLMRTCAPDSMQAGTEGADHADFALVGSRLLQGYAHLALRANFQARVHAVAQLVLVAGSEVVGSRHVLDVQPGNSKTVTGNRNAEAAHQDSSRQVLVG